MDGDKAEERVRPAVADHHAADDSEVEHVLPEHVDRRQHQHAARQADRADPGVVGPDREREVLRGAAGVVRREVVVDQLLDLARRSAAARRRCSGR